MTTTNKMETEEIVEMIFEQLKAKHSITLEERETKMITYFKEVFGPQYYDVISYTDIEMIGMNEEVSLFIDNRCNLGEANFKQNRVWINVEMIDALVTDEFESVYKKETPFIKRNVSTKEEAIKWIVCHEFAHTLRIDKTNHTKDFFTTVEQLYQSL